jgi:hypothetical protein
MDSATLIDNIFTNNICESISSGLLVTSISDHLPVFAFIGNSGLHHQHGPQFTMKREMGRESKIRFREMLKGWDYAPHSDSASHESDQFRNEFRDIYNVCFPLVRKRVRKIDLLKPWLCDDAFLSKVREKNQLFSRHLKGGLNQTDTERLGGLRSEVNRLRRDLKRSYFARRLEEVMEDSRRAWEVIHEFIEKPGKSVISCPTFEHNGRSITGNGEIAEGFCRFFTDIGPDLADKVRVPHGKSHMDYLGNSSSNSMFMMPTTPREIE